MKTDHSYRPKIREIIVCEGRDDTIQIKKAVDCMTVETHGFGIKKETWDLIEKAYKEKGIIVLTDPDFSGEEIRRKISQKFPKARHAFLTRNEATKGDDIGVENATGESIIRSIKMAKCTMECSEKDRFTMNDMKEAGLQGNTDSKKKRQEVGKLLGIGYGNCKTFLARLNKFDIAGKDFYEAVRTVNDKGNSK